MARKQVNFRLDEETIEQLKYLVLERNERVQGMLEERGLSHLKVNATWVISTLIETEYKKILKEKYENLSNHCGTNN